MFGQNFDHLDSSDVYGLDTTLAIYLITSGGGTEIRLGGEGAGACVRGCKATNYPCEASACEGQKLGGLLGFTALL